jgi:hypothetical protein
VIGWTLAELAEIDAADEVDIATRRADGTLRRPRIVWVVRLDDAVYVRSVNGTGADWYRGVQTRHEGHLVAGRLDRDITFIAVTADVDGNDLGDALNAAYRAKYHRWPGPVAHIISEQARAATLRLDPA